MEYYDLVLGSIPGSILGAAGMFSALGIGLTNGVIVGALLSALLILHALFVRTPQPRHTPEKRPRSYHSAD